jgi:hypothetical protein
MSWRFRKRLRIIPGFAWVNLSKSGASLSVGGKGATINLNRKGVQGTLSAPGTGVSYRSRRRKIGTSSRPIASRHKGGFWSWFWS